MKPEILHQMRVQLLTCFHPSIPPNVLAKEKFSRLFEGSSFGFLTRLYLHRWMSLDADCTGIVPVQIQSALKDIQIDAPLINIAEIHHNSRYFNLLSFYKILGTFLPP